MGLAHSCRCRSSCTDPVAGPADGVLHGPGDQLEGFLSLAELSPCPVGCSGALGLAGNLVGSGAVGGSVAVAKTAAASDVAHLCHGRFDQPRAFRGEEVDGGGAFDGLDLSCEAAVLVVAAGLLVGVDHGGRQLLEVFDGDDLVSLDELDGAFGCASHRRDEPGHEVGCEFFECVCHDIVWVRDILCVESLNLLFII